MAGFSENRVCTFLFQVFNIQIMARNVRTNVKKMVNHTIGVGKSPDPGIIVHLVSKSTFFN